MAISLLGLSLAACGQRQQSDNSANDFAQRVGTGKVVDSSTDAPGVNSAVKASPPATGDVFQPEKLGDISHVKFGPRAGGCTFSVDGKEMLVAAGPQDRNLPGKATVRVGGKLLLLDAPPGGYQAVKNGTTFSGEGISVAMMPTAKGKGTMTITNTAGQTKAIAGDYVCS
ncbi:hypothetical protein GRI58_07000 [Porphyrobacter algicida]|uniref:Uncharacterized protein n=1 Tax=Qipengyuania algicida TaxID=1836209 RepID=A0A845AGH6_9SPHN|nr:hypothetical protein [Qipengyuania algicida]MXP28567.1 hypothetical protein [Qipengyuania algicida]